MLFKQGKFKKEELQVQLKKCSIEDLIHFSANFLKNLRFEWFIGGNVHKNQAIQFVQEIESQWKVDSPKIEELNVFQLKE